MLTDKSPSEPKTLVERQVKKIQPRPAPGGAQAQDAAAVPPSNDTMAAILNSLDEGGEGQPEADLPEEFDYESDGDE